MAWKRKTAAMAVVSAKSQELEVELPCEGSDADAGRVAGGGAAGKISVGWLISG
jgi:hypothetical protein